MDDVISLEGVVKRLGSTTVLQGLDLQVRAGEILGLLGPNGSGKTTTLRLMAGFYSPDEGSVRICGRQAGQHSSALIGYMPERTPLYDALTVRQYLGFAAHAKIVGGDNVRGRRRDAIDKALQSLDLQRVAGKAIGRLSKGFRQRVGLAQAVLNDPPLLLLDEATNGLDPLQIIETRALIRDCAQGRAVVFSSHLMQEVEALCTRVAILRQGRLIADAPMSTTTTVMQILATTAHPDTVLAALRALPSVIDADGDPATENQAYGSAADRARAVLARDRAHSEPVACHEPQLRRWRITLSSASGTDPVLRILLAHGTITAIEHAPQGMEDRFLRALHVAGMPAGGRA